MKFLFIAVVVLAAITACNPQPKVDTTETVVPADITVVDSKVVDTTVID